MNTQAMRDVTGIATVDMVDISSIVKQPSLDHGKKAKSMPKRGCRKGKQTLHLPSEIPRSTLSPLSREKGSQLKLEQADGLTSAIQGEGGYPCNCAPC